MNKLALILLLSLSGCANKPIQEQPSTFILGPVVAPPMGCIEMRKINPKADC